MNKKKSLLHQKSKTFAEKIIEKLIRLAATKKGYTTPNPLVAAAVVKDEKIIALGVHAQAGEPHAEVFALKKAGDQALGADIYVVLEPCTHYGKTPPCTEAIIKAGIKRVFYALDDPNPLVKSNPAKTILNKHNIEVIKINSPKAAVLNEVFIKNQTQKKPFVSLKLGMSLDGKIALPDGRSKYITSEKSLNYVHKLRVEHDAILVGINTVLQDNPQLNIRFIKTKNKKLYKIILDSGLKIPVDAKVLDSADVIIFTKTGVNPEKISALQQKAKIITVDTETNGTLNWNQMLDNLFKLGIMSVLIEGGKQVFTSAITAGIVDKLYVFIAPKLLLGEKSIFPFGGQSVPELDQAIQITNLQVKYLNPDVLIMGNLTN